MMVQQLPKPIACNNNNNNNNYSHDRQQQHEYAYSTSNNNYNHNITTSHLKPDPTLERKLEVISHLIGQLQSIWQEIDKGITHAMYLWDLISGIDDCSTTGSFGSDDYDNDDDHDDGDLFDFEDDSGVQHNNNNNNNNIGTGGNVECFLFMMDNPILTELTTPECAQLGPQLTQLINIENSILNVIEHYQFCVEQYIGHSTSSTNSSNNSSCSSSQSPPPPAQKKQEQHKSYNKPDLDYNYRRKTISRRRNSNDRRQQQVNNRQHISQKQVIHDLEMNRHIDLVCKCAQVFSSLRKVLLDQDQVFEVKVMFQDIFAITGHLPNNSPTGSTDSYICMLEKAYYKFQRKMKEYEQVVGTLATFSDGAI